MKKFLSARLCGLLFFCIFLLRGFSANATHIVAADLQYKWISGNTYKIILVLYGNCSAGAFANLPISLPQISIYDGDTYKETIGLTVQDPYCGVEVTPVICPGTISQCIDPSSIIPGITEFVFSDTITLSGSSHFWRFIYNGSGGRGGGPGVNCPTVGAGGPPSAGRGTTITNIANAGNSIMQLIDTLDNTAQHNSSPDMVVLPTAYYCIHTTNCYYPGAIDRDDSTALSPRGDSLVFTLVPATVGLLDSEVGGPVTYVGIAWLYPTGQPVTGATPLQVDSANEFNFDPTNGQICFTPNLQQLSDAVYNIREFRNGNFVGSCQREMTFLVEQCPPSTLNASYSGVTAGVIKDSTDFQICSGSGAFSIFIDPKDNDTAASIMVTPGELPGGATFTTAGNGTRNAKSTFSWTTDGLASGIYSYVVTFSDNHCPYGEKLIRTFHITIAPPLALAPVVKNDICNTGKGNLAIDVNGGVAPYTYHWSNDSAGATVSGLAAGTYSVAVMDNSGCKNSLSVNVGEDQYQLSITPTIKNDICKTGNGKIAVATDGGTAPYSYRWSIDSVGTQVSALLAGTYTVTSTDVNGCKNSLSVNIDEDVCPEIIVHDVITPNGDGFNDVWVIEGLQNYPKNMVQIFDKWGDKLFERHAYNNDWGGKGNNGELLPDGTYYYVVKLNAVNGAGGNDVFTGALLIKR